jgi:hypothetical protein
MVGVNPGRWAFPASAVAKGRAFKALQGKVPVPCWGALTSCVSETRQGRHPLDSGYGSASIHRKQHISLGRGTRR